MTDNVIDFNKAKREMEYEQGTELLIVCTCGCTDFNIEVPEYTLRCSECGTRYMLGDCIDEDDINEEDSEDN